MDGFFCGIKSAKRREIFQLCFDKFKLCFDEETKKLRVSVRRCRTLFILFYSESKIRSIFLLSQILNKALRFHSCTETERMCRFSRSLRLVKKYDMTLNLKLVLSRFIIFIKKLKVFYITILRKLFKKKRLTDFFRR